MSISALGEVSVPCFDTRAASLTFVIDRPRQSIFVLTLIYSLYTADTNSLRTLSNCMIM